jgi:hypothetical protein
VAEAAAKWSRLAALTAWQWRVLLTAPFVLLATWVSLHHSGYRATLAGTRPAQPSGVARDEELGVARDTALALAAAIKFGPWRPRCLLRSLALARLLGRRGIACEVCIGLPAGQGGPVPGAGPDFSAHAWVEYDGVVLNDRDDVAARFLPFDAPSGRS